MARMKGTPKTGGRKAGTPNKLTGTLKEFITNLIDQNRQQIEDDISQLEPKERLSILERLMGYVIPKQTKYDAPDFEKDTTVVIEMVDAPYKPVSREEDVIL